MKPSSTGSLRLLSGVTGGPLRSEVLTLLDNLGRGLEVEKTEQLSEMRADFAAKAKQVERDARKRAAKEKKLKEETNALLDAVKRKGIEVMYSVRRNMHQLVAQVQGGLTMETLEPLHPAAVQRKVRNSLKNCVNLPLAICNLIVLGKARRWQADLARAFPIS